MNSTTKHKFTLSFAIIAFALSPFFATDQALAFQSAIPAKPTTARAAKISMLKNQIAVFESAIQRFTKDIDVLVIRRSELQNQIEQSFQLQNKIGVSSESYPAILKTLQSQRVQLMIDLAGVEAKRNAIEKALVPSVPKSNQHLIKTLQALVDAHEERFKKAQNSAEKQKTNLERLSARVQLAHAKTQVSTNHSSRLNEELLSVSLDRAEKQARLEKTESLLETIMPAHKTVQKDADAKQRVSIIRTQQADLTNQLRQLNADLDATKAELARLEAEDKQQ